MTEIAITKEDDTLISVTSVIEKHEDEGDVSPISSVIVIDDGDNTTKKENQIPPPTTQIDPIIDMDEPLVICRLCQQSPENMVMDEKEGYTFCNEECAKLYLSPHLLSYPLSSLIAIDSIKNTSNGIIYDKGGLSLTGEVLLPLEKDIDSIEIGKWNDVSVIRKTENNTVICLEYGDIIVTLYDHLDMITQHYMLSSYNHNYYDKLIIPKGVRYSLRNRSTTKKVKVMYICS